ncbi:MAG: hypothetical protein SF123_18760 [Chloroflexota bacterium]|nr:hypothetical protein [Chloroflexota bacterium]
MRRVLHSFFISLFALAACAPAGQPTLAPTLTLIPATQTPTPTVIPATITNDPALISAESLLTATIAPQATATVRTLAESDPIAAELIAIAQRQVAEETGLPTQRIRVIAVETMRWSDSSLGCPQPEQTYAQVEIDGYRIVLMAGDREYIFHTDFDRIIRCETEPAPPTATP